MQSSFRKYLTLCRTSLKGSAFQNHAHTSLPLKVTHIIQKRHTHSEKDIAEAKKWLQSYRAVDVPTNLFDISYSRASGAGGQKVNKTSSKATVALESDRWLNPQFCYWIPGAIRTQLATNKVRYETKSGGLLIQSDSSRNRDTNTDECFRKLVDEIKLRAFFASDVSEEDKKKWEDIKEDKKEKRLFHKKKQSDKKKSRSKNFDF